MAVSLPDSPFAWCSERFFPSAATNPNGPYLPKAVTQDRPTLHSEFSKLRLEAAVDAALKEAIEEKLARKAKASAQSN